MAIRASIAAHDITPRNPIPLQGCPGAMRLSTAVSSPLLASAIHLRGGSGGILVLSLDLLCLDPGRVSEIRRRVETATGIRESNILVGTTQNHSGPVSCRSLYWFKDPSYSEPDQEYLEFVTDQCVHAAAESAVATRPASVAVVEFERHDGGAVIVKDNINGRIMAVIVVDHNIADHLGGSTEVSSDFIHHARQRLASRFGGSPVLAYFPGQTGDLWLHGLRRDSASAEEAGVSLAEMIVGKVRPLNPSDFAQNFTFSGKFAGIESLASSEISGQMPAAGAETGDANLFSMLWEDSLLNLQEADKAGLLEPAIAECLPFQIQVVKIGPIRILGLPCRVMPGCGLKMAEMASQRVWVAECAGGDLLGSVLAQDAANADKYILMGPVFSPEGGAVIAKAAVVLAADPLL